MEPQIEDIWNIPQMDISMDISKCLIEISKSPSKSL